MTSLPIIDGGTPVSSRATSTPLSSETSPRSFRPADLGRLKYQVEAEETSLYRDMEAILAPKMVRENLTFSEMKMFERQNDVLWLGPVKAAVWYLPRATTLETVMRAVARLAPEPFDRAPMLLALQDLWFTTRHERMDAQDRAAMLEVYVQNLEYYPSAVTRLVLWELQSQSDFFPSWAEIERRITQHTGWRGALIASLRLYAGRHLRGTAS